MKSLSILLPKMQCRYSLLFMNVYIAIKICYDCITQFSIASVAASKAIKDKIWMRKDFFFVHPFFIFPDNVMWKLSCFLNTFLWCQACIKRKWEHKKKKKSANFVVYIAVRKFSLTDFLPPLHRLISSVDAFLQYPYVYAVHCTYSCST